MAGARPWAVQPAWGWYRLDRSWAERLVADAGVRRGDLVLDIGAGDGALTAPLVAAGARVIAIELHPGRAATLRHRFANANVRVVQADASDLRLPRRPYRVVANPPWSIIDPLLRRLLHPASRLERADLLLKRSATRRWADTRLTGFVLTTGVAVPRRAFQPAPPTDGRILIAIRMPPGHNPSRGQRRSASSQQSSSQPSSSQPSSSVGRAGAPGVR